MEKHHQYGRWPFGAAAAGLAVTAVVAAVAGAFWLSFSAVAAAAISVVAASRSNSRPTRGLVDPQVLDAMPLGVALCDEELRPCYANPALLEMMGAPGASAALRVGIQDSKLFSQPAAREALLYVRRELRPVSFEAAWTTYWGRPVEMRVHLAPTLGKRGRLVGGQAVFEDIAERNQASRLREENDARLRELADHLSTGIFLADGTGEKLLYANRTLEQIVGITASEADYRAERFIEKVHPDDRASVERSIADPLAEASRDFECRICSSSDSEKVVRVRSFPVCDERGEVIRIAGSLEDITEVRRLHDRLLHSQKMEAVGTLAAGVAHDFNNVLTVISGYAELLRTRDVEVGSTRRAAAEIQTATERASTLIRQMLAFRAQHVGHPQAIDLGREVLDMSNVLRRLMGGENEVAISVPDEAAWILGDHGQIEQLILNLIFNARDAMPNGGRVEIDVRIRRGATAVPSSPRVTLTIRDDGVGMDEEVRRRTFDPFFTTKDPGAGSGLGLFAVFGIVRQMSGEITVESAPGAGTAFEIDFPYRVPQSTPAESVPTRASPVSTLTILLVEDETRVRELAGEALRTAGYRVVEASDGVEALERLAEVGPIDLLVSDIVMPRMNGVELTRRLRAEQPDVPVVLVSGYPDRLGGADATPIPACSYLPKPFRPSELLEMVAKAAAVRRVE